MENNDFSFLNLVCVKWKLCDNMDREEKLSK